MRVVRQLLIEGATLAALGGAVGLVVATLGLKLFTAWQLPRGALPYWVNYTTDVRVVSALVAGFGCHGVPLRAAACGSRIRKPT